jgi:hypothetical protein
MVSHRPLLSVDLFLCGCTELHTVCSVASVGEVRFVLVVFVIGMGAEMYVCTYHFEIHNVLFLEVLF